MSGEVGRCGHELPRVFSKGSPPNFCALPADHAGWHKGDDGSEWTRRVPSPDRHQQTAAEAVEAAMVGWLYPHDRDVIAAALAAAEQRGHDRLARKVEALAEEMDREDPQVSTWHIARRLRALLTDGGNDDEDPR